MMYFSRFTEMLILSGMGINGINYLNRSKLTRAVARHYAYMDHGVHFKLWWVSTTTYEMEEI